MPLALVVLTTASAVVVATEFIVVGLLPVLSRDLGVSTTTAGRLVGAFALSASLLGPPLTLATAQVAPHRILIGTLLLFAAGDLVALLLPGFRAILAVRIIQGAALPVFISVGAATVSRLSPPELRGRSLALANTGFAIGVIFAVPAGVALAESGLWTPSFVALAGLAAAAAGLVAVVFPRIGNEDAPRPQTSSHLLFEHVHYAVPSAHHAWGAFRSGIRYGDEHLGCESGHRARGAGRGMGGGPMGHKRNRMRQPEPRAFRARTGCCTRVKAPSHSAVALRKYTIKRAVRTSHP